MIKNAPDALLSYISTWEFIRTREKCLEKHFSSVLKNTRGKWLYNSALYEEHVFIYFIKCPGDLSELSYEKAVDEIC